MLGGCDQGTVCPASVVVEVVGIGCGSVVVLWGVVVLGLGCAKVVTLVVDMVGIGCGSGLVSAAPGGWVVDLGLR